MFGTAEYSNQDAVNLRQESTAIKLSKCLYETNTCNAGVPRQLLNRV
jgi:hypothetical protein